MNYRDFFGCKYPLICMPMNGVSDMAFAIDLCNAGVFPSLSSQMFFRSRETNSVEERIIRDFDKFTTRFGHCRLLFSMTDQFLAQNYDLIFRLVEDYKLSHIELVRMQEEDSYKNIQRISS